MLLAIDTATHLAAIALYDAQSVRGAQQWRTERNHTVELLPNIIALLRETQTQVSAIQAIAVASGPGSYTGLRIGLSVAKGFCFAQGAALVGVPTLDISAQACAPRDGALCAVLQAGRGRLSARFYRIVHAQWQASGEHFLGRADELATACEAYAAQPLQLVGEIDEATQQALQSRLGARVSFAPDAARARDPRVLAQLGWARWQRGDCVDVATFAPFYG